MGRQSYLIALGSNRRSSVGNPRAIIGIVAQGAFSLLGDLASWREQDGPAPGRQAAKEEVKVIALSRVVQTLPLGPGKRRYANAVALIETDLAPPALLAHLKTIERAYGRRPGRRWGARPLDLDIIGWSGGIWASPGLAVPHPAFRMRRFVLAPLVEIAPDWRNPVTHLTARQLLARLDRKRPRP